MSKEYGFAAIEALPYIVLLAGLLAGMCAVTSRIGDEADISDILERCSRSAVVEGDTAPAISCLEAELAEGTPSRGRWQASAAIFRLTIDPVTGRLLLAEIESQRLTDHSGASLAALSASSLFLTGAQGVSEYAMHAVPLPGYFGSVRVLAATVIASNREPVTVLATIRADSHAHL